MSSRTDELDPDTAAREADRRLVAGLAPAAVDGDASAAYLGELARRPRLAPPREQELILRARRGDRAARTELIEAFLPLIHASARLYRRARGIERTELIQEGVVGLLRALERYDPDRGVPFWGYAAWWVRHAMQQLVAELTRPVVLSDRALRQLARIKDVHRAQLQQRGREPTYEELADATTLTVEQVVDLVATDQPVRALDEPVRRDEGALGTFGELVTDPLAEGAYERVLDELEIGQLRRLLAGLSERERMVLRARYGLEGEEQSLRQVAERLGVSGERVRQIEQRALGKLRAALQS